MSVYLGNNLLAGSISDVSAFATKTELNTGLTGKANTDLSNVSSNIDYIIEQSVNGTEGYRVYKSGICEQWGETHGNYQTVNLSKTYADTNYNLVSVPMTDTTALASAWHIGYFCSVKVSPSQVKIGTPACWRTIGKLADG